MALTVTDNSVKQIYAALLSLEKKINETNSGIAQDKQNIKIELENAQYEFISPLKQNGTSVSLDTTGAWEGTAVKAVNAERSYTTDSADITKTEDTVNGDKLQIGTGTSVNITNAEHAANADKATSADKVKNALTVNGKTYDGSSAVNAGVQTVANGGTGVTTQADINKAFISNLTSGTDNVTDGTEFVSSWASDKGFAEKNGLNTPYKRQFIKVWNYIKDKIKMTMQ